MMDFINENLILVSLTIFVFLMAIFNELKIKEGNMTNLAIQHLTEWEVNLVLIQ